MLFVDEGGIRTDEEVLFVDEGGIRRQRWQLSMTHVVLVVVVCSDFLLEESKYQSVGWD